MSTVKFATKIFGEALGLLGAVVDPNSKLNIYTKARLTISQGVARVAGNSLPAGLSLRIPVKEAPDNVDIAFEFKPMQGVIGAIGTDEIILEITPGASTVQVKGVGTNFVASVNLELDLSKFPSAPAESFSGVAALGLPGFKDYTDKTIFAVPAEDGKYTVTTALLHSVNKQLHFVATDGHRLVMATMDVDPGSEFRIQIPKTALDLVKKLEGDSVVNVFESGSSANDGAFRFTTGQKAASDIPIEEAIVRKTSGKFPPYEQIFINTPTNLGALGLKQPDLLASILRLLPMADRELPLVVLKYTAGSNTISLKTDSDLSGFAYDSIPVEPTGEAKTRSFESKINATFLKDWLEHASGDITFYIPADNNAPLYFATPFYKYVMAPVVVPVAAAAPAPKAKAAKAAA